MTAHLPAIEVQNLSYAIQDHVVLESISFCIPQGDYIGILGPNGSGKTTLLKIILGILEPQEGSVKLFGDEHPTRHERAMIGYVPQRASKTEWDFPATVEEVIHSGRTPIHSLLKSITQTDREAVNRAMKAVDIVHLRNRVIGKLSGGERQRVFIARALAAEPKILILDEPTTGVDVTVQHEFYAFLKKLNTEQGITIIIVSHDVDAITHETRTVLCMNRKLVCHMPTEKFLDSEHLSELFGHQATHLHHEHDVREGAHASHHNHQQSHNHHSS